MERSESLLELDKIYFMDCLEGIKLIADNSIDLIVTDPPYEIENTKAGGNSKLARSIQQMNDEIKENNLTNGFNVEILDEMVRVMKTINIYIWCNHKQIPMYIDYFVNNLKCSFDILIWNKPNAMPLFNNKYLTDKEYCLYFRKNGKCDPASYEEAKTVYYQPINAKDKKSFKHPTIKPLNIIETIIKNSSNENDIVLDCFMGSGTTAVACINTKRKFIGFEYNEEYYNIANSRVASVRNQLNIFDFIKE